MRSSVALGLAVAATAVAAPGAFASTPASGHVDADRLVHAWTGEAYGQPFKVRDLQERCDAPFCDEHTVTVRTPGALTLVLDAPDSAGFVDVEVVLPDGTIDFYGGSETETRAEVVYPKAAPGAYRVRVWPNMLPAFFDPAYSGKATLKLPAPPPSTS